jgi:hypothetical protein
VKGEVVMLRGDSSVPTVDRLSATALPDAGAAEPAALAALRRHWPEYLIEAAGLGLFMVSACVFASLLEHPGSPVRQLVADATLRRIPMGLAMAGTAMAIVYSRWGQRSGAHLNPAWRSSSVGSSGSGSLTSPSAGRSAIRP